MHWVSDSGPLRLNVFVYLTHKYAPLQINDVAWCVVAGSVVTTNFVGLYVFRPIVSEVLDVDESDS